ncbi:hypothetical protein SAMN06265365_12267 [Tistlia consotensis]|uniref:Uncharacterized protein n=1 Tax=Tistlia consotensis USBA 355 TaxID=560819 RepID=A0A1Y6CGP0_9PROT|nr:hypothetical protein [Tistlia consotensis]SMF63059.1 hypothetical protein SAMN05428998_12467 [Tistlia consotensis USBA 355]SNR95468.1 hypothetical protein SAMN06265365_12267 [Tistlia consotensis]
MPLVVAAVPRFVAGLLIDRHELVFYDLELGRNLESYDRMWSAIAGYESALRWSDDAQLHQRLAGLYLAVARDPSLGPAQRRALLTRSIEQQRIALGRAPADAPSWLQLAYALYGTEGISPAFQRAYRRSIELAPYAPALAATRALLGLRSWPWLDAQSRALVPDQVALAVEVDADKLVRQMVTQGERRLALFLLAGRPEPLASLEAALDRT